MAVWTAPLRPSLHRAGAELPPYRTITVAWVLKDWAKEFHEFP